MEKLDFYNFENHSLYGHMFHFFEVHSHNIHFIDSTFLKYYKHEKTIFFFYVAITHVIISI